MTKKNNLLIKSIINDWIVENSHGLVLIDAPTGIGKTYQTIKYIQENYKNKKIIFVANQEKLLPEDNDLYKGLNQIKKKKFEECILKLPSLLTTFKTAFKDDPNMKFRTIRHKYPLIYDQMNQMMRILNRLSNHNMSSEFGTKSFYDLEKEFRKIVVKELKTNISEYDKKHYRELYPSIDIYSKNVLLMTTKKFFNKIDPLTKKSFYLINNPFDEETIVIFDEIDSVKNELLDIIIGNVKRHPVDIFGLFKRINEEIRHERFITDFPITDNDYALKYKEDMIDYFSKKTSKYHINYNDEVFQPLNYFFKSYNINDKRNFIFDNGKRMMIAGNKKTSHQRTYIRSEFDPIEKINYLSLGNYSDDSYNSKQNVEYIYKNIFDCINHFVSQTLRLTTLYQEAYNQTLIETDEPLMDFNSSLSSILDKLNLGLKYTNYIKDKIYRKLSSLSKHTILNSNDNLKIDRRKHSHKFYENGFSYLELVDSESHNFESKFYLYDYDVTPEKLLASLALKVNVIGLSATATIASNIINFDLEYFKYVLKDNYYSLSKEMMKSINQSEQNIINNVDIHVIDDVYDNNNLEQNELHRMNLQFILKDDHLVYKHLDYARKINNMHALKTCADIYNTINKFLENKLHSLIIFVNNNITKWDDLYNLIKETSSKLLGESGYFKVITSTLFKNEGEWDKVKNEFKHKDNVVLVSAYQTVSLGMNLQYENYLLSSVENKDIDCIFIQKPTQIIPYIHKNIEYNQLISYIYAIEYSRNNDTITSKKANANISDAFKIVLLGLDKNIPYKYSDNVDITLGMTKQIIQALGRIKRVKNVIKPRNIMIYTTNEVVQLLGSGYRYLINENSISEFKELLKYSLSIYKNTIMKKYNDIDKVIKFTKNYLDKYIDEWNWTYNNRRKWLKIREFVLRFPTFNTGDLTANIYIEYEDIIKEMKKMYFYFDDGIDQYSFGYRYKDIREINNGLSINRLNVSSRDAGLSSLIRNEYIKTILEHKNIRTSWKSKQYVMSAGLYIRIYKGALGEVVGKIILEQFGIQIHELNKQNNFELFDYKYSDNVMIDFKNWSNKTEVDLRHNLKNINDKANRLDVNAVYVINVFKDSNQMYEGKHFVVNNINVYTIPWLFDLVKDKYNEKIILKLALEIQKWRY